MPTRFDLDLMALKTVFGWTNQEGEGAGGCEDKGTTNGNNCGPPQVEEDVEITQLEKENSSLQLDVDKLREELSALNEKQGRRGMSACNNA